ncbi:UNVERIFIED_ORG: hypothetical protein J2X79_004325 [Arthrobacter globiformis]|nr:hypothetical protein [Arthrobacter globiformis]
MAFHNPLGCTVKHPSPGHNYFALLSAFVLAVSIIFTGGALGAVSAATAASAVSQCNGIANVGGEGITCTVTVTNTLNLDTGVGSSVVTVEACEGAAHTALTCTTTTTPSNELVTVVDQCNGSGNGGGSVVECSVTVVNNITGTATALPGSVNQCNSSGQGGGTQPTVICNPIGSTTNATVTQCNGSGNGGGGTARVQCTVGSTASQPLFPSP